MEDWPLPRLATQQPLLISPKIPQTPTMEGADLWQMFRCFQENIVSLMETWFTKQQQMLKEFTIDMAETKFNMKIMESKWDGIENENKDLKKQLAEMKEQQRDRSDENQRMKELEVKVDSMEQYARICNVEINNLPERKGEDLMDTLLDIAAVVKHPISKLEVVSIHRVPHAGKLDTRPRNVIVKFCNRQLRDSFIAAARRVKNVTTDLIKVPGEKKTIYIQEHLTLKNKGILRKARDGKKTKDYQYVWVKNGIIRVKPTSDSAAIPIHTIDDLAKAKAELVS